MALIDDFRDACISGTRTECIGAAIKFSAAPADWFYISDSRLAAETVGTVIYESGWAGLEEIGEAAGVGVPHSKTASFMLYNKPYVGLGGGARRRLQEVVRGKPVLGSSVILYLLVNDGNKRSQTTDWITVTVFDGVIADYEFGMDQMRFECVQQTDGAVDCPALWHDGGLVVADDGADAEEVETTKGTPIPFGIGRFDATAVQSTWPTGHLFNIEETSANNSKNYGDASAVLPGMLGFKHPCLPTVLTHKNVLRDGGLSDSFHGFVCAYGAEHGTWPLDMWTDRINDHLDHEFPGHAIHTEGTLDSSFGLFAFPYTTALTWQRTTELSVATPFMRDMHMLSGSETANIRSALGAGRHLYTTPALGPVGLFFPMRGTQSDTPTSPERTGLVQAIALPFNRISTYGGTNNYNASASKNITFTNTATGSEKVFDSDLSTYVDIASGEVVSLEFPPDFNNLGTIVSVRVCILWDPSNTDDFIYMSHRQSPSMGPHQDLTAEFNCYVDGTWTAPFIAGLSSLSCRVDGTYTDVGFSSMVLCPLEWNGSTVANVKQFESGSNRPGWASEWSFYSMGLHATLSLNWLSEAAFWVEGTGKTARIYNAWIEVVYKSRFAANPQKYEDTSGYALQQRPPHTESTSTRGRAPQFAQWTARHRWSPPYQGRFITSNLIEKVNDGSFSPIYLCGRGVPDDVSGSITGTARSIIERPDHIIDVLLRHFNGGSRTVGALFGSFVEAGDDLGNINRMSLVVKDEGKLVDVIDTVAMQARSFAYQGQPLIGGRVWWMFTESDTTNATRLFRGDGFYFGWGRKKGGIRRDTFSVKHVDLTDIATSYTLNYGFHDPTSAFAYKHYCTPTESSFATAAATYVAACATAETNYNVSIPFTVEAPDIWDPAAAEEYLKWWIKQKWQKRLAVEFTTYALGAELRPGHIIRFDDEIGDAHPYPGESGATAWSDVDFLVSETIMNQDGPFVTVTVRCLEKHSVPPTP